VVDITFVFPQWDISTNATPGLVDKWNKYIVALELHEKGHKEIAIEAGYEIGEVLNALTSYPSCDELERAADIAAEEILEQYRQREVVYDQETEHGATQGVGFP
jgi:predicted secreted Zn-dependent protease